MKSCASLTATRKLSQLEEFLPSSAGSGMGKLRRETAGGCSGRGMALSLNPNPNAGCRNQR